jgi:predicted phage terminase large subunit-like protein
MNNSMYETALSLFLKYNGKDHRRIEREMRDLGFAKFHRRIFYDRKKGEHVTKGWISRHKWQLRNAECGLRNEEKTTAEMALQRENEECKTRNPHSAIRIPQSEDDFQAWLKQVSPTMTWDWRHQKALYEKLQKVTSGECKRLMIFMPPRHGKSEMVTVRYAAWRLLQDPSMNIIIGSYGQKLANRFSRKIKNVLADATEPPASSCSSCSSCSVVKEKAGHKTTTSCPECGAVVTEKPNHRTRRTDGTNPEENKSVIPNPQSAIGMFPRSRPANTVAEWETALGGGVRAVGVGAGVTGYGAKLVIVDDPVKNRAHAESETYRNNTWDWFNDDIYTRLEPDASMIVIQTRWHEDDLAGRLIRESEHGGEQWDVLSLPALAEANADSKFKIQDSNRDHSAPKSGILNLESADPLDRAVGQALCPDRYDEEALLRIKRQLGSYSFAALFQQRPMPRDGGLFKRSWFKRYVAKPPEGLRWCRGYDLAISTNTSADYTASFRCALDKNGDLYIDGGFRKRIEFPEQRRYVIERMLEEKNTAHGVESALHGVAVVQELRRDKQLMGKPLKSIRVDADKFTRALSWANLAEDAHVVLVRGAWNDEFLEEACKFTGRGDAHDDQIDAVSLAVRMLRREGKRAHGF